ncbi:hypothetical protein B0T09DRAFT_36236 [Sordaria sp. MPI-SDFR-AT-0083]|nr:hypothetical protein B0T09DRAFT_36236 [Sordaria sp. MPI-SDFR-AT-0083]
MYISRRTGLLDLNGVLLHFTSLYFALLACLLGACCWRANFLFLFPFFLFHLVIFRDFVIEGKVRSSRSWQALGTVRVTVESQ